MFFNPLLGVYWRFCNACSAHSVHGPSLWPARHFGILCQTAEEIRILAGTASDVC